MANLINTAEMEELTGAKAPAKQCDVLRKNGMRFTLRADGRPSLSWEAYNRQLAAEAIQHQGFSQGPRLEAV